LDRLGCLGEQGNSPAALKKKDAAMFILDRKQTKAFGRRSNAPATFINAVDGRVRTRKQSNQVRIVASPVGGTTSHRHMREYSKGLIRAIVNGRDE
jgi:hypothetical protein